GNEALCDQLVDRRVPRLLVRSGVAVELTELLGVEELALTRDRVRRRVRAGVTAARNDQLGEPDATERVAELVTPDRGRRARLDFDAREGRRRDAVIDPVDDVLQRGRADMLPVDRVARFVGERARQPVARERRHPVAVRVLATVTGPGDLPETVRVG